MEKSKEEQEKKELERSRNRQKQHINVINKQIEYNNKWPRVSSLEIESTINFLKRLKDSGYNQILSPVILNDRNAEDLFLNNPKISKIFSTILDIYDLLPLHPDIAFDVTWRALEIAMKYIAVNNWKWNRDTEFIKILKKACTDIFCPYASKENGIKEMFEKLFSCVSLNSLRYLVVRLYIEPEMAVSPQQGYIIKRANDIIGKVVLDAISKKFINSDGSMPADRQRSAASLFSKIMREEEFIIEGTTYKSMPIEKRIEFYISCVLYSSRCERYHGDHYSPLKSSLSTLHTYYEYYYLLIFSYAIFWLLMHKIQEITGGPEAISIDSICKSIEKSIEKCQILPNK